MEDRMARNMLTELRSRLADIMSAEQLLLRLVQEKGSPTDRTYLAVVDKSLYSILRTIQHAETCLEEPPAKSKPLDLAGLCRDLGRGCEDMAKVLGVHFEWKLENSSVISQGHKQLLQVAILNLLTNAFRAAGPGGHVTLEESVKDGRWMAAVEDDGPGLPAPEREEDPFLKKPGGVGMGLEVARKAARLHDGALMLVERTGGGVRAVLSLPIKRAGKPTRIKDHEPEFPPVLVEFAPLLPLESFDLESIHG